MGGWRNREEKLCAGHDAAAAVQRSRENNIQTEYFCLSPFCLQDPLSLEFRNFDIDILAFTPLGKVGCLSRNSSQTVAGGDNVCSLFLLMWSV